MPPGRRRLGRLRRRRAGKRPAKSAPCRSFEYGRRRVLAGRMGRGAHWRATTTARTWANGPPARPVPWAESDRRHDRLVDSQVRPWEVLGWADRREGWVNGREGWANGREGWVNGREGWAERTGGLGGTDGRGRDQAGMNGKAVPGHRSPWPLRGNNGARLARRLCPWRRPRCGNNRANMATFPTDHNLDELLSRQQQSPLQPIVW